MNINFIVKNYPINFIETEKKQKTNFGTIYPMLYRTQQMKYVHVWYVKTLR